MAILSASNCIFVNSLCRVNNGNSIPAKTLRRGIYFSPFGSKIGSFQLPSSSLNIFQDSAKITKALSYFVRNQIDSISFYNLNPILESNLLKSTLVQFMKDARACGIVELNAVGGQLSDFITIKSFQTQAYGVGFDGVIVEQEFWNAANVTLGYIQVINLLQDITALKIPSSKTRSLVSRGIYIGWLQNIPNAALRIAQYTDRIYIHCYRTSASTTFPYCQERIQDFINTNVSIELRPIFSCEGAYYNSGDGNMFMGDWLASNSLRAAEEVFAKNYSTAYPVPNKVRVTGYQYYEYAFLDLYDIHA